MDLKMALIRGQLKSTTQIWQISSVLENLFNESFHFIGIRSIDLAFLSIMSKTGTACGAATVHVNKPLLFSLLFNLYCKTRNISLRMEKGAFSCVSNITTCTPERKIHIIAAN